MVISILLAVFAILFTNILQLIPSNPANGTGAAMRFDPTTFSQFLALPLMAIPVLTLATPVLLLFVYDKNNGVLEYLLSLGWDQSDVFKVYLRAALFLGSIMSSGEVFAYIATSALRGAGLATVTLVTTLSFAISLSTVSFVTVAMMAFSSLQKQRVGANQPLGIGLGFLLVIPSIYIPLISQSNAPLTEIIYSTAVMITGLTALILAGRLISREKLLP